MVSIFKFGQYMLKESTDEAETHIKRKLDQIELKLKSLFETDSVENGEIKKFGQSQGEQKTNFFKDLELQSIEQSKFAKTYKNVKVIFSDDEFRYDVTFKLDLKDAVPAAGQEFDPEGLKECDVEFKRYSLEDGATPLGQTEKKVQIDDINQDMFEELLVDLEKDYPSKERPEEEFKIETEEGSEEEEES
jgi:hypothetical protein